MCCEPEEPPLQQKLLCQEMKQGQVPRGAFLKDEEQILRCAPFGYAQGRQDDKIMLGRISHHASPEARCASKIPEGDSRE